MPSTTRPFSFHFLLCFDKKRGRLEMGGREDETCDEDEASL